jgi:hypothetical protein
MAVPLVLAAVGLVIGVAFVLLLASRSVLRRSWGLFGSDNLEAALGAGLGARAPRSCMSGGGFSGMATTARFARSPRFRAPGLPSVAEEIVEPEDPFDVGTPRRHALLAAMPLPFKSDGEITTAAGLRNRSHVEARGGEDEEDDELLPAVTLTSTT